ncbi:MAG: hypothetical protein AAGB26_08680 [Planctomycetota bacterium]
MNVNRQHISTHLQRVYRAVLPGGRWHLGELLAVLCQAEPVAIHATKCQAMPSRDFIRGTRKA